MVDGVADIPCRGKFVTRAGMDRARSQPATFWPGQRTGWSKWPSAICWPRRLRQVSSDELRDSDGNPPESCYNPLVLYGPSGTGKSHVARGLAAVWKAHHRRHRVVCTTAVEFARELADAIESQAVEEFRTKYRNRRPVVFEDLGHLATRNRTN